VSTTEANPKALKLEYTPEEYIPKFDRQSKMAQALRDGLSDSSQR
jgi:hypothetical protein